VAKLKSMGRPDHGRTVRRRRFLLAGLALFLLIDVALVASALTANRPPANAGAVVEPTMVEPVETTPPVVEPVETKTPVETKPVETMPPARILSAFSSSAVWRATTGACPGAQASPELSTNGGATWTASDASADTGASSILVINAISESQASLVTLSATDCAPQLLATYVAGAQWAEQPHRLAKNWYLNPSNRAVLTSPSGQHVAPCSAVIGLVSRSDTIAGALCSDGTFARTGDGGASWGPATLVPGAVNLAVNDDGYLLAAAGQPGCSGVKVLSTLEAFDGVITSAGCREATFSAGEVALASADGIVWLWAGDSMSKSSDGGVTWQ
jgi:hypothetical protein